MGILVIVLPVLTVLLGLLAVWVLLANPGDWLGLRQRMALSKYMQRIAKKFEAAVEHAKENPQEAREQMCLQHQKLSLYKFVELGDVTGLYELEEYSVLKEEVKEEIRRHLKNQAPQVIISGKLKELV